MGLPRKPVRRLFRFVFRLIGAAIATSLDLERPERPESRSRPARRIAFEARRR
ncbi:hypothetical protein [Actinokineospora sp. UTMC 2448]|uniref:hypothetical protein n=1 Tax=Actinokineospora sp. UTMC 2448 TaxID=2268449 RepID=UPI002164AA54|nr:hypothetical protein [Actinokineospora sp. UTMC 2448]UVS80715.1 hypothetical protein Actkin_04467 [Actinokineospora sp. UTMC 2448]